MKRTSYFVSDNFKRQTGFGRLLTISGRIEMLLALVECGRYLWTIYFDSNHSSSVDNKFIKRRFKFEMQQMGLKGLI
jgi:hypothetical protein